MRISIPVGGLVMIGAVVLLLNCATHPLGMSDDQWNSLTPHQQEEMHRTQRMLNEHQADARRCRQEAEMQVNTAVPLGGLESGAAERLHIRLGQNQKIYKACMQRAGWTDETTQPIIN